MKRIKLDSKEPCYIDALYYVDGGFMFCFKIGKNEWHAITVYGFKNKTEAKYFVRKVMKLPL